MANALVNLRLVRRRALEVATAQRVDNASLIQKTTAIVGGGIATVLLNRLKKWQTGVMLE